MNSTYSYESIDKRYGAETLVMQPCSMAQSCTRPERLMPDSFWIYSYKVALCPLKYPHDFEKCVYAHEGEKARRRHPSKYQAVQCPEARAKKVCPRGEECPCTHHLFEYWLHPDRYMTCLCELGSSCNRPICFFAHHAAELRPLPDGLSHAPNSAGSSKRHAAAAAAAAAASSAAAFADPAAYPLSSLPSVELGAPATSSAAQGITFDLGLRQAGIGSVNATADAGIRSVAATGASLGGLSSAGVLPHQGQQAQQVSHTLGDLTVRPGFTVLGTLSPKSSPSPIAAGPTVTVNSSTPLAMTLDDTSVRAQLQSPGARSNAVIVLEAPAPIPTSHAQQLLQAVTYFSQLNLSTTGSEWHSTSSSPFVGQSSSNMSLASISSSTTGASKTAGSTSTAALHDALQQQVVTLPPLSSSPSPPLNIHDPQQAAMDQPPELLSFSLWDPNMPLGPDGTAMQGQNLAALGQVAVESSLGCPQADAFVGFPAGLGAFSQASTSPTSASAQVLDLASTAAKRLLAAPHVTQASTPAGASATASMLGGQAFAEQGLVTHVDGNGGAVMATEARLTLLRAWLNAAVALGDARTPCNGSSLQHQEDDMLKAAVAAATGARSCSLSPNGSAVAVEDLSMVLHHAELLQLLQQLQQQQHLQQQ